MQRNALHRAGAALRASLAFPSASMPLTATRSSTSSVVSLSPVTQRHDGITHRAKFRLALITLAYHVFHSLLSIDATNRHNIQHLVSLQ